MTIRNTLLLSYLLISLASALLITLMIFVHLREILRLEIENKLKSQATTIMQQIDTTLFERFENMAMWSQLDVMQEVRVRDVDKRLAHFLDELHDGYGGIYEQIFAVDKKNETIASTDPNMIGKAYQQASPWLSVNHKNHTHTLQYLDATHEELYFSIPIPDVFESGELGQLYASFDWKEIFRLLDAPLPFSSHESLSYALLVDANNRIIATSSVLHQKSLNFNNLSDVLKGMNNATGSLNAHVDFLDNQDALIGYAQSQGYRTFKGLGWRVLILQPTHSAFAPIWDLWITILIFLCLTSALSIVISFWISAKIARPISRLAVFTRDFMQGKQTLPPQLKSSREITELSKQFSLMISHLEQSKQDLVRVSKLAVIGEMAASMAHEVRTPLGILRSSAQILQREPELSEIGHEMTEFILSETQRLNGLVTTLLECARPRPPKFAQHNVHGIIEHCVELLRSKADNKNIRLATQLSSQHPELLCDRDQIIQVLLNLLMNAIQHVNPGGLVEVSTRDNQDEFECRVSDDGVGISDANKVKVFEPFFTQRQEGIGLGLTVVQQIVLAHHGKIFVTDSAFGGACFNIFFPLSDLQEP